ncbi:MAG TPA: protein kinase [Gemmatimonadales bacterium]
MAEQRLAAALADRYRVERELGQGGMATVYLAHDLRHDRDVAIKVLHPDLGAALGGDRFLSEIRTTARLQHPHILPLLDSGEADGLLYYVMPLVTGETLRARLDRERQLPVEAAVRIASEVADALDYAHGIPIVHRDIKPENILLQGGHALVADFGIALAVQQAGGQRMTQTGLSLGTPQYMSPEQAMGERTIDARSDIYALGAVLYEMLVGEPPFTGPSVQAIVARLVTEEPRPIHVQRKAVPEHVEAAVMRALEKLPADRFAHAADLAAALADARPAEPPRARTATRRAAAAGPSRRAFASLAFATALLAGVALWGWLRPVPGGEPARQRILLWDKPYPDLVAPSSARVESRFAISPDGSTIAFTDSIDDDTQLLVKRRNEVHPVALAGTTGAAGPFFSPDGEWIGYFTHGGKLRKVPVAGGGSIDLASSGNETYVIGAWLDDGRIIFVNDAGGLSSVRSEGGPTIAVRLADAAHRDDPSTLAPLPGSRGVLFTGCPGNCATGSGAYVYDFTQDSTRLLVADAGGAWYSPTGHLLYASRAGGLFAAPFDLDRMEVTGGAVPVVDGVAPGGFALSRSGSALYTIGTEDARGSKLVWVSRDGSEAPFAQDWIAAFEYPALSPDGTSIAVSVRDATTQLWIGRVDGSRLRISRDELGAWRPSWTPDGRHVAFTTTNVATPSVGANDAWLSPADGSRAPRLLADLPTGIWEVELSRDGKWVALRSDEQAGFSILSAAPMDGRSAPTVIYGDSSFTTQIALSPDSRWLAFTSDRSGRSEVYVASFPGMQVKYPISQGGGTEPRWAHSGRELFFKSRGQLMSLPVAPGSGFAPGNARALFPVGAYARANNRPQYDVAPDDRRFLMIRRPDRKEQEVVLVENFLADLAAKVRR